MFFLFLGRLLFVFFSSVVLGGYLFVRSFILFLFVYIFTCLFICVFICLFRIVFLDTVISVIVFSLCHLLSLFFLCSFLFSYNSGFSFSSLSCYFISCTSSPSSFLSNILLFIFLAFALLL